MIEQTLRGKRALIDSLFQTLADGRVGELSGWGGYCTSWPGNAGKSTVLNGSQVEMQRLFLMRPELRAILFRLS